MERKYCITARKSIRQSEYIYQMKDILKMIEKEIGHSFEIAVSAEFFRPSDEKVIAGNVQRLKLHTG